MLLKICNIIAFYATGNYVHCHIISYLYYVHIYVLHGMQLQGISHQLGRGAKTIENSVTICMCNLVMPWWVSFMHVANEFSILFAPSARWWKVPWKGLLCCIRSCLLFIIFILKTLKNLPTKPLSYGIISTCWQRYSLLSQVAINQLDVLSVCNTSKISVI